MSATLAIVDELFGSPDPDARRIKRPALVLDVDEISVRDLIRFRVEGELDRREDTLLAAAEATERGRLPVEGHEALNANPTRTRGFQQVSPAWAACDIDREPAVAAAQDAFVNGEYLLLLDGRQACDLDERVTVRTVSEAVFLRLLPLVGG